MLPMELPGCHVLVAEPVEQVMLVTVQGDAKKQPCPDCGHESDDVHSYYVRKPQDLPAQGRRVRLHIIARRWRCLNQACARATFCESFKGLVERHAQRTERITEIMRHLILVVSSTVSAHVAHVMGMQLSGRTFLRVVNHGEVQAATPRVLGIDDFALRRGRTYGTLLCDLETGKPIDVLIGRGREPLLTWLRNHPGIEIVARDRASSYADAVRLGAPQAIQVADRFHLVKNLYDALKEVVDRQSWALPELAPLPVSVSQPEPVPEPEPTPEVAPTRMTRVEQKRAAAADRLAHRYEEVQRLRRSRMSIQKIHKATGLSRQTIYKYLNSNEVPKRAERRQAPSKLDPFVDYLRERWRAGCHREHTLYEEIVKQGYGGSAAMLRKLLQPWRAQCPPPPPRLRRSPREVDNQIQRPTWKEVRAAVLRLPEHLNDAQQKLLPGFLALHPKLSLAHNLVEHFRCLLKEHNTAAFDTWLTAAAQSELDPFERLARALNADRAAILAAVQLKWSTGPVEGQITRVKLMKRIGYGRASLPLLRARILGCA
jgi:transposase